MTAEGFKKDLYLLSYSGNFELLMMISDRPSLLWLPQELRFNLNPPSEESMLVRAKSFVRDDVYIPLLFIDNEGNLQLNFNAGELIRLIRHEKYYDDLEITPEMKLPFNYSRLPDFIKGFFGKFRAGKLYADPLFDFPEKENPYIVDWLQKLHHLGSHDKCRPEYPDHFSGAVVITHDVDTNWIFKNQYWLDIICDMEGEFGFRGAWYCVPENSSDRLSEKGIDKLLSRGCEIGCHGFSHDAKFPLVNESEFNRRMALVKDFSLKWGIKGFRSEWLWRNERFIKALSSCFEYDTSIPSSSACFTTITRNGCGTAHPYRIKDKLIEIPLSLPMDVDRIGMKMNEADFWNKQFERSKQILHLGGVVTITLHPQSHQFANEKSVHIFKNFLKKIDTIDHVWKTRPIDIVERYNAETAVKSE